jgi:uncharacterized protein YecE (DUF72 family)
VADAFGGDGPLLARYARVLPCVEINSSFYRPHRAATYARWASSETPPDFRFSVKLPRALTHEARLQSPEDGLAAFFQQAGGLGPKLGVVLVQLPPSLRYDASVAADFFGALRAHFDGAVVCEPRHASWFTAAADDALAGARVGRVAADPVVVPEAARPGGWLGPAGDGVGAALYHRWHGSPRMYESAYDAAWLRERASQVAAWPAGADCWCIFDNTAAGAAAADALEFARLLGAAADEGSTARAQA